VLDAVANTGDEAQDSVLDHPSVEEVGKHFPELEIIGVVGVGGMGVVYKARQTKLDRFVALKLMSAQLAEHSVFVERFNREGRVLAQLNHPHIVNVFDFGSRGDFLYLLMEFVDGVSLREAMQAETIAPADCLVLVQDICSALQFAHEQGVLHRDIKPENVLLDQHGRVKLADFGIAKLVSPEAPENISLTNQNAVLGTLHYMAPEQLETPRSVDHRADIYSLGVVFYELLTGELPIGRFPAPSDASMTDPRLDKVVLRALEKRRDLRYQTVEEVKTDVESLKPPNSGVQQGVPPEPTAHDSTEPIRFKTSSHSRYATLSAIFTGVSLVFLVLFILVAFSVTLTFRNATALPSTALVFLLALVPVLLISATGILGTLFGLISLSKISSSQGQTRLVRALFGGLTWPILLLLGICYLVLFTATPTQVASLENEPRERSSLFSSPEVYHKSNGLRCERIKVTTQYSGVCRMNYPTEPLEKGTFNTGVDPLGAGTYVSTVFTERHTADQSINHQSTLGARNGHPTLTITTAQNGTYWPDPTSVLNDTMSEDRSGGGVTILLPDTMSSSPFFGQEPERWDDDSCFPIYTQSQLDQFIERIPLELPAQKIATDLPEGHRLRSLATPTPLASEEPLKNRDPLLEIPGLVPSAPRANINFETHFAIVVLNYRTLTSVPMVESVKYEHLLGETWLEGWTNRIWIDVVVPALPPEESCPTGMGTYRLVVIPRPGTYQTLNFRFSQSSSRKALPIPMDPNSDRDEPRTFHHPSRLSDDGKEVTSNETEEFSRDYGSGEN